MTSQSSKAKIVSCLVGMVAIAAAADVRNAAASSFNDDERPNIILFLVDDLGWQDSSVTFDEQPSLFQQHYRTPNLVHLAQRGLRFNNAYAHCVCTPTRVALMTGQSPARLCVTNWTLKTDAENSGTTERLAAPAHWHKQGLRPPAKTLASRLRDAGYRTIHAGKAHWGAIGTEGSDPCKLGFDVNIAGHAAGAPGSYQGLDGYDRPNADGSPSVWAVPGLEKYHGTDTHLCDAVATEAIAAIDQSINDKQPFFLYMAPYAVHTPIQEHPRFIENYRGKHYPGADIPIPENEARYASMVEGYDAALGAILDQLRDRNVADRTIVIFTSDNGGLSVHTRDTTPYGTGANTHNRPLREGKGSAYEGGTRVPFIISWATPDSGSPLQKKIPVVAGTVCEQPIISEDLMPTICHWAGIDLNKEPEADRSLIDGHDLTPVLLNKGEVSNEDRPLLFHYPHVWGPTNGRGYQPHSAMRLGPWKVIYFYDINEWELYELANDIGEENDLAASNPDKLAEMSALLIAELQSRGAQYPTDRKTGQPTPPLLPGK